MIRAALLIYEDVSAPWFSSGQTDVQIIRRGKFAVTSAGDKLHNRLLLEDTTLNDVSVALNDSVGINDLFLIRSKFNGSINGVGPRNLFINDCDVIPPTGSYSGISTEGWRPV